MKKSQQLSRKTWKLLAKNLIVLAVLIAVTVVGVLSWFTTDTETTAKNISVKTEIDDGLEYYIVPPSDKDMYADINAKLKENENYNKAHPSETPKNTSWHANKLTFDFSDPEFKFMEDLFLCEVTGDGKTFQIPKLLQYGEIAYVDPDAEFDNATANEDYMSFDIYFRTKASGSVAMKTASSIVPKGEINPNTEEGVKNAAIGAVRMSVLNGTSRELLWIPGPCVWFDGLDGEGVLKTKTPGTNFGSGSVTYNGTGLAYTGEYTTTHAYYNASHARVKDTNVIASTDGSYQLGSDKVLVTLSNKDSATGYNYGHVRINLWVEGEDAEARLKCVGGKFDMTLKFTLVK